MIPLDGKTELDVAMHGTRACRLAKMAALGLPVPLGVVLSAKDVSRIAETGAVPDVPSSLLKGLLSLRASPLNPEWGGPTAILNIGISDSTLPDVGENAAYLLYRRFIQSYATNVAGLEAEDFDADIPDGAERVAHCKASYKFETDEDFPQDPKAQLRACILHMARAWNRPSAKILRQAKGAPEDAGFALVIQRMALGIGRGETGAGAAQMVDDKSGAAKLWGRYLPQSQGQDAVIGAREALGIEALSGPLQAELLKAGETLAKGFGDAFQVEFTVQDGRLWLLDCSPAKRSSVAALRINVDLAEAGIINKNDAILRTEPHALGDHLHPQIAENSARDILAIGLSASPGAATGRVVFTPEAAMTMAAQGQAAILVRVETGADDIRGIHAASGVLTLRGGMTSHAAVIARGLGVPCIVGAGELRLDDDVLVCPDGRRLKLGAQITVDGTSGQVLAGSAEMTQPNLGGPFKTLMSWADEVRELQVRANADTPADARLAQRFGVDGIGLCRTEHMFFAPERVQVMREMILAPDGVARKAALDLLMPMQKADFVELFEIMRGQPVTIRLLDPPLHEFMPVDEAGMAALAQAMGISVRQVARRAEELSEVNPMLGKRGVRIGITTPEIYEMQVRAIFEAAAEVSAFTGDAVVPEIMIPLVSANREVELIKARIEAVALEVGGAVAYKLGVMVETPRAALRAGDLAESSAFLSFGTNDLTQMTYGLSRDDAGRFMREYVQQGVFPEDPFHSLDVEGVGELLLIAAQRGRAANPALVLGMCGEHGGDPASVRFCKVAGFDYVSCSPYRVPIARLAAAQASLLAANAR